MNEKVLDRRDEGSPFSNFMGEGRFEVTNVEQLQSLSQEGIASEKLEKLLDYTLPDETKNFKYRLQDGREEVYEYYDLLPETEKGIPVIYATGFASNGAMIPGIMGSFPEIAERRLLFADEVIGIPYIQYLQEKEIGEEVYSKYEPEHLKKAVALVKLLDVEGIEQADIFAHSEGAIHALIAANLFPDRFKQIVINSTVGLADKQEIGQLVRKTVVEAVKGAVSGILSSDDTPKREPAKESYDFSENKIFSEIWEHNWNVFLMLWKSLKLIPKADIRPYIEGVREQGIKVSLVHADGDKAFTLQQLQEKLGGEPEKYLDGFHVVDQADHNTVIRQPGPFIENVITRFFSQS